MKTRVKICGLTNIEDAQFAVDAGADMIGFIFYARSPRYVSPETVGEILSQLNKKGRKVFSVGVFVNEPEKHVARTLNQTGLDLAQLHGDEHPKELGIGKYAQRAPLKKRAYKALRPRSRDEALEDARRYARPAVKRYDLKTPSFLIDAYDAALRGGTGLTVDWQVAAEVAERYALLLAGGLTPQNVEQAVKTVLPWGVDVASGVEAEPGRKDHDAVKAFIERAKGAL